MGSAEGQYLYRKTTATFCLRSYSASTANDNHICVHAFASFISAFVCLQILTASFFMGFLTWFHSKKVK